MTGGVRSHFRQLKKRDKRPIIVKRLPCAIALHLKAPPTGHRRFFNRFGSQADLRNSTDDKHGTEDYSNFQPIKQTTVKVC